MCLFHHTYSLMNSKMVVRIAGGILNECASEMMSNFKTVAKDTISLLSSPVILKTHDFLSENHRMHSLPSSALNRLQQIGQYEFEP